MQPQNTKSFKPHRAWGLYILGISFLLAPFINFAIGLKMAGVSDWYSPKTLLWAFLHKADAVSRLQVSVTLVSGFLLFVAKKWSRVLCLIVLIYSLGINIKYNVYSTDNLNSPFLLGSIFSVVGMIVILFYFRYPYLDRRTTKRVAMVLPVECSEFPDDSFSLDNISTKGLRINTDFSTLKKLKSKQPLTVTLMGEKFNVAIQNIYYESFSASFLALTTAQKRKIRDELKKTPE